MRILIVGHKGQLGSELIRILQTGTCALGAIPQEYDGADLIAVDIDDLNIANRTATLEFMNEHRPDIIINCAAYTRVDDCETHHDEAMAGNSLAPRNLAEAATAVGAKLIHVSTDYVFDGKASDPYTEDVPANPVTAYGRSKLLGEKYVSEFCKQYFIVRTAWLYGRNGNNFVKTMIRLFNEREIIKVVNDQWGSPTNAEDLAYHMLLIALTEQYGIYHCTNNGSTNWYGFSCAIAKHLRSTTKIRPCSSKEYQTLAKRPKYSVLENTMLKLTVGDYMRSWEAALNDYMKEYIEQNDLDLYGGRVWQRNI